MSIPQRPYEYESIVIKQVEEVAVYRNENGDVVIAQQDSIQQEYHVIVVPVERALDVAAAIKRVAAQKP